MRFPTIVLASFISLSMLTSEPARSAASITAAVMPAAVADAGGPGDVGTPYAVFVRIQGWTSAANSQAYLKIYSSTNNEYMWNGVSWSDSTKYSSSYQPVVSIDASGNWSGWIYAKHNTALGISANVRAAKVGATSTNVTQSGYALNVLTMSGSGSGGWIARPSSPAVDKGVLAYSNGSVVGAYRTEDNGIAEGYSYAAGGFRIAVPAGIIDSLVCLNDDGSRDQTFVGPWFVSAGLETDASTQGGQVGKGKALFAPAALSGAVAHEGDLRIYPDAGDSIRSVRVVLPPRWTVAGASPAAPGSPVAILEQDTITVDSLSLVAGDTLHLTLQSLIPYDSTGTFKFAVSTGMSADSLLPIAYSPSVFVYSTPLPISDARANDANGVPLLNSKWITVRGVVTVAGQLGSACYLQDNSGGLVVYGSTFAATVHQGDEVIVSGIVQPFNGLMEIVQPFIDGIVSSGNSVEPLVASASQIANDGAGGVEVYEGRLVRLNGLSITGSGTWTAATNYPAADGTGSTELRIDGNTDLPGRPIPTSAVDVIGVVGQYMGTSPYIGGYQIFPRSAADILSTGPVILTFPVESEITPHSLTISWQTVSPGTTKIRFGKTPSLELGVVGTDSSVTDHSCRITGLDPATVYYCVAFSSAGPDTSIATPLIASTASATGGAINAYFNKSVNPSLAWYRQALGNQDLASLLITRIDSAHRSVDAALYSLSGTPGYTIAAALARARNRGLSVRVICESDNRNTSPFDLLAGAGVPLITDAFDPVNAGAGLMHNKFFLIDGRGGAAESVWVWTGSWNPTDPGTNDDYQNSIEIQDAALAGAYTMEFNEMWGSGTDVPNASVSRFGARKTDNTPHRFVIGGRSVECYFSPSDHTTSHIIGAINGAAHSVAFSLLTLTRRDIASAIVARKSAGAKVRGLLDNGSDQGSQYSYLVSENVDVLLKSAGPGLLHHKYGLIDAENPAWGPVLMTGSHNWTSSAENSNNENTLIIHDADLANQYLQEFAARYYQFNGTDSLLVGVRQPPAVPLSTALEQNYPNPFNPTTAISYQLSANSFVNLKVYDILGRLVATLDDGYRTAGAYTFRFDASRLASGVYFYQLTAGRVHLQRKMLLLR